MPTVTKATSRGRRRKVVFLHSARQTEHTPRNQDDDSTLSVHTNTQELGTRRVDVHEMAVEEHGMAFELTPSSVPHLFRSLPPIQDFLATETSILQEETVQECLPYLKGTNGSSKDSFDSSLPHLEREKHIAFLQASLKTLPDRFVTYDASRPWIVYWALNGLTLLGSDISQYRQGVIDTFSASQNPDGGFGGGFGQLSHCAAAYAAILCLSMVGGREALDLIDRRALWKWLGRLKQPNGGFAVVQGGEVDVRGAYCALVMISLLCLPLDLPPEAPARQFGQNSFLDELPEWLSRCQTYEGGISCSPDTEAHGAYAFLVIASFCILGDPHETLPKYLDCELLTSWISSRQYAPEGGFAGRTNKLVDTCYSHWIGGCWPMVEVAMDNATRDNVDKSGSFGFHKSDIGVLDTPPHSLYCREGLIRYIMCCCQAESGGLRDKPGKNADAYHSCYALAGLSSAQHRSRFASVSDLAEGPLECAFGWSHIEKSQDRDESDMRQICDLEDIVEPIHPIFVIPYAAVEHTRSFFSSKAGF